MAFDRALLQDIVTIGFDGLFGLVVALFLFSSATNFWVILLGAVGAILPDPLSLHSPGGPKSLFEHFNVFTCGLTQNRKLIASSWRPPPSSFRRFGRRTNSRYSSRHL
jgi:hypothetical protein